MAPTTTPAEHRPRAWRLEFGVVAATVVSYPLGLWLGLPWVLPSSEPLLSRIFRYPYPGLSASRRYFVWAGVGILADWGLKGALAPLFRTALRSVLL